MTKRAENPRKCSNGYFVERGNLTEGNSIVRCDNDILLHTIHVNTVGNVKYVTKWYGNRKIKKVQSNTTKTTEGTRLKFVSDKKKMVSLDGSKNTRIEFSTCAERSANYTSNVCLRYQKHYRNLFELVIMSQGEVIIAEKPLVINNVNYTTYIYGVANPQTLLLSINTSRSRAFHKPLFFSSVNVSNNEIQNQLFISMTINSQKLTNVNDLKDSLRSVIEMIEIHKHLNRVCTEIGYEKKGLLTTAEKMAIIYITEEYFSRKRLYERDSHAAWPEYELEIKSKFRFLSCRYTHEEKKVLGDFEFKNPEFVTLLPWILETGPGSGFTEDHILCHARYLEAENKRKALCEFLVTVELHRNACRFPRVRDGSLRLPVVAQSDFERMGFGERALRQFIASNRKRVFSADGRARERS